MLVVFGGFYFMRDEGGQKRCDVTGGASYQISVCLRRAV